MRESAQLLATGACLPATIPARGNETLDLHPDEAAGVSGPKRIPKPVIGWREWLALPSLNISAIKAKVDTGARSSALHAFDVEVFHHNGREMVRFKVHPFQRDNVTTVESVAPLYDRRAVRTSAGHETMRPVILAEVELDGQLWAVELTLTRRDAMGFRMLLGRQAIRRRFQVEPGRSYLVSRTRAQQERARKRTSG
jgi:hypothetical protein